MPLITDEYRKLNEQMHKEKPQYGTSGADQLDDIVKLIQQAKTDDVLDYGCGKGELSKNLPFKIQQYDPAIAKHSALPEPANIVVCTEVLEHIEPECIDEVLDHLQSLVKMYGFFTVSLFHSIKTLPDGRNAHILVKDEKWWIDKICERFVPFCINLSSSLSMVFIVMNKDLYNEKKQKLKEDIERQKKELKEKQTVYVTPDSKQQQDGWIKAGGIHVQ